MKLKEIRRRLADFYFCYQNLSKEDYAIFDKKIMGAKTQEECDTILFETKNKILKGEKAPE